MSPLPGKLIVIEGLEGAGKSTAVTTVIDYLKKFDIKSITTREPGGTAIGEMLRAIIKNPENSNILNDKSELLLLYTARVQLLEQVIKPALKQGIWVVADRFELSSRAYQGGGRGLDQEIIDHLSQFCLQGFKPDLTLFLDITPESGMQRAKLRGNFDRIEQQALDFFHRVYHTYQDYTKNNPDVKIIDAERPLFEVQQEILTNLHAFIEQPNEKKCS